MSSSRKPSLDEVSILECPGSARLPSGQTSSAETAYIPLSPLTARAGDGLDSRPLVEDVEIPPDRAGKRLSARRELWVQCLTILWLVPICTLLGLNIRGYVVGASAWCPEGRCRLDFLEGNETVAEYNRQNHNLLGALQLASKALEIWFSLIAGWLVYLVTMHLASQKEGLPVAHLLRARDFADIVSLFRRTTWPSRSRSGKRGTPTMTQSRPKRRIWIFVIFTAGLGVLCNLMGPATAVLILPTLQWRIIAPTEHAFLYSYSDMPPTADYGRFSFASVQWNCNDTLFADWQYSCVDTWSLDAMVQNFLATDDGNRGVMWQGQSSFTFNMSTELSTGDMMFWTPSRQTLADLSDDLDSLSQAPDATRKSHSRLLYDSLSNSQQGFIQRLGPYLGAKIGLWQDYNHQRWWDVVVDEETNKLVRCYQDYNISNIPLGVFNFTGIYTKCIKWGFGWEGWTNTSFQVAGVLDSENNSSFPYIDLVIWTSDRVAWIPQAEFDNDKFAQDCLRRSKTVAVPPASCDWEGFFNSSVPEKLAARSYNVTTIQISSNWQPRTGHPNSTLLMIDFTAFAGFTTYSLDPAYMTNPTQQVSMGDWPENYESLYVDPTWVLYAWSADEGGRAPTEHAATTLLSQAVNSMWYSDFYNTSNLLWDWSDYLGPICAIPIMQTLSLIDYEDEAFDPDWDYGEDVQKLWLRARVYVWAYGMSSRTAYMGATVAILGCFVVVAQFVLGLKDRRQHRSPMEVLVAALEYVYQGEFEGKENDQRAVAATRYRVEDDLESAGKLKFVKAD